MDLVQQALKALAYYLALVCLTRLSGKRLAGQTTTFDLIVLISISVVLQTVTLKEGIDNAVVFLVTVWGAHMGLTALVDRSPLLRSIIRGGPRVLIRNGQVRTSALRKEGLSHEDLMAGLRKQGVVNVQNVKLATFEETGHISVIRASA